MSSVVQTNHSGVQDLVSENNVDENNKEVCEKSELTCEETKDECKDECKDPEEKKEVIVQTVFADGSLGCDVCNIRVTSTKILQRHLDGKRHKARVERKGKTFYCDICDIKANSEAQLNIHLTSSKHKSKIARNEFKEFTGFSKTSAGIYILVFCAMCIFLNFIIMLKIGF